MSKIIIALSGGVDSAVSAWMLSRKSQHQLLAVHLQCWHSNTCSANQDRDDAIKIATYLKIPIKILDFEQKYYKNVFQPMISAYQACKIPNPDIDCNAQIKFKVLIEWMLTNEYDKLATGHYAQILNLQKNYFLSIPKDLNKDQTYFLSRIDANILSKVIFPLANYTKKEVREIAKKIGLPLADKKDSVGICFLGKMNMANLIKDHTKLKKGPILNHLGKKVGVHQGLQMYTIGQRHSLPINGNQAYQNDQRPIYVIDKDISNNSLIIGHKDQAFRQSFYIDQYHSLQNKWKIQKMTNLFVRVRHRGELIPCTIVKKNRLLMIKSNKKVFAINAGQSAVFYRLFYKKMICIGSAIII